MVKQNCAKGQKHILTEKKHVMMIIIFGRSVGEIESLAEAYKLVSREF